VVANNCVNKKPLASHEEVQLRPGSIIHFSQPDVRSAIPHAYRFQILYVSYFGACMLSRRDWRPVDLFPLNSLHTDRKD